MTALVSDAEVKAIIDTSRDTTPFINTADLIVTEQLASSDLSAARLKLIELYLAAHFVAITEEKGALKSTKMGDSEDTFGVNVGFGLKLTRYGQQAISLDPSGVLSSLSSTSMKALFRVV